MSKNNNLPFQGVNFNIAHCAKWTEAQFIEHEKHHDLTPAQLKEAYKLIKEAAAPVKETTAK